MEKIKIELNATTDVAEYVDELSAIKSDKHIVYETTGEDTDMEVVKVTEVKPRILLGEFPVAVEVVLEEGNNGSQKVLMLNLQDLLDKYHEEYDNAKA
jgi:hypothetical protein